MNQVVLAELDEEDLPSIQAVFDACEDYFILTTGGPATPAAAHSLYIQLPEGKSYEDKHIFGICEAETAKLVGVIDAILGYPEIGTLTLGLFLIVPEYRRRGIGKKVIALLAEWSREQGLSVIRVGVHEVAEDAMRFWERVGFRSTGQTSRDGTRTVIILEKPLCKGANDGI